MFSFFISSFIAGFLTFLAPCTLPLVPAYVAFIGGTSANSRKVFQNALFFVLGFSAVFILFGTLAGSIGGFFIESKMLVNKIGGVFIILFGLFMLRIVKIPFLKTEKRISVTLPFSKGAYLNSLILGIVFGAGWTPCVGPVLGSVLFLASQTATAFYGASLLAVFSLGLAVPFLLIAASVESAEKNIAQFSKYLRPVNIIGGAFLVILGISILFDKSGLLLTYGFNFDYGFLSNYL